LFDKKKKEEVMILILFIADCDSHSDWNQIWWLCYTSPWCAMDNCNTGKWLLLCRRFQTCFENTILFCFVL